jgi:hypothetical protein
MLALMGGKFDDIITIENQSQAIFVQFKAQDFCKCFQRWRERWARFCKSQGKGRNK